MNFQGNWYCLYTKAGQEKVAKENLDNQGFTTYLPYMLKRIKRNGRYIEVKKPLFTSYIFASVPDAELQKLRSTRGVSYPLSGKDGLPLIIEKNILDAINTRCPDGILNEDPNEFQTGEKVEVIDGPLSGANALFQKTVSDKKRALILVNLLCNEFEMEVDLGCVEKSDD